MDTIFSGTVAFSIANALAVAKKQYNKTKRKKICLRSCMIRAGTVRYSSLFVFFVVGCYCCRRLWKVLEASRTLKFKKIFVRMGHESNREWIREYVMDVRFVQLGCRWPKAVPCGACFLARMEKIHWILFEIRFVQYSTLRYFSTAVYGSRPEYSLDHGALHH